MRVSVRACEQMSKGACDRHLEGRGVAVAGNLFRALDEASVRFDHLELLPLAPDVLHARTRPQVLDLLREFYRELVWAAGHRHGVHCGFLAVGELGVLWV